MPPRVRKTYKERQRELEQEDVVEEKLWTLSDWMEENWKPVVTGLAVVSGIWAAVGIGQIISASSAESAAEASAPVFAAATATVYEPPEAKDGAPDPNKPFGPSYPSAEARAQAVVAAAQAAELGDDAAVVALVEGAAHAELDAPDKHLLALDKALGEAAGTPLEVALLQQKAGALTAAGQKDGAIAAWQKVAEAGATRYVRALAHTRIADLKGGERAGYEKAVAALVEGGAAPTDGPEGMLHLEASQKLLAH
jgi:tetratricopeptide (TPR) repeat protein